MSYDYEKKKKVNIKQTQVQDEIVSGRNYAGTILPDDYNPNLDGKNGWMIYDQMFTSDTRIQQIKNLYTQPIIQNKYYIDGNGASKEQVSFFKEMFFDDFNLKNLLLEASYSFVYGQRFMRYSLYKDFKTGMVRLNDIVAIPCNVIVDFSFNSETNRFEGIVARGYVGNEYSEVFFSVNELMMFFWNKRAEKPFGESMFRPLYKNWKFKDTALRVDILRHERSGAGIVSIKKKKGDLGNKTLEMLDNEAEDIGENLRIGEKGYVAYYEEEMEVGLMTTQGQGSQPLDTVRYHDAEMNMALLAGFMNLGQNGVGSFATAKVQEEPYLNFLNMATDVLLEPINNLIQKITIINWGKQERYVKIGYDGFRLTSILPQLIDFVKIGIITPEYVGQILRLPEEEINKIHQAYLRNNAEIIESGKVISIESEKNEKEYEEDYEEEENKNLSMSEDLSPSLARIEKDLDSLNRSSLELMVEIKDLAIKNLVGVYSTGKKPSKNNFNTLKEKFERKIKNIYRLSYMYGYKSIPIKYLLAETDEEEQNNPDFEITDIVAKVLSDAVMYISLLYFSYFETLTKELNGLDLSPYSQEEIERIILERLQRDFSKNKMYDFGAYVNTVFAKGRNKRLIDLGVQEVRYTGVLDKNICVNCKPLDNKIGYYNKDRKAFITKDNITLTTPNPLCLGSYRCRCQLLPVK